MFALLETFIAVFETKSFTRAASQCFISQPTATVRIKKLEEELKVHLFSRGQHQEVIPTESAHLLYPKALKTLNDWNELQFSLKNQTPSRKPFKIAASHSSATTVLPLIFKNLIPELEQLNIELMMLDSQEVFDLIRNHEIHFGIIEKPMMDETIETFPLFKDELVLAGKPENDIFFIREAGSGVAHYTHNYLKENNLNPKNLVSVNNNDMIVSQLKAGIGLSLISKRFINENIAFQGLGERYQRIFYGLSFLSEQDKLLKTVIKKIKNLSEF